jgi:predicted dehydrogenase
MLPGKVRQVYSRMYHVRYDEVDDGFKLLLTFENGLPVFIEVSTCAYVNLPRWHVSGNEGTLEIRDWSCDGRIITVKKEKMNEDAKPINAGAGLTKTMAPRLADSIIEIPLPEVECKWTDYYLNIIDCLNGNAELIVKPEQAMRVMKVMEAAFCSEAENRSIDTDI